LADPEIRALIAEALGEWNCEGFVVWKRSAAEWVLGNLDGHTPRSVARLLHEHVASGGEVDQVRERRHEYASRYEFHYDFRIDIDGRRVYIETTLDNTSTGPMVAVVSIHDA
jgi:hypothetical protein